MTHKELFAIFLAFVACMIWSGNFVIARGVNDWIMPITLAFWRWLFAFVCILPIGYLSVRREWTIITKNWAYLIGMGILGIGVYNTLIYFAGQHTTTHHIAIISSNAPIGTLVIAGLMGVEKLSRYKVIGAICAFSGALVVVTHGNLSSILEQQWNSGDIILIFSTLIWASWSVASTFKPKELSTKSFLTVVMGIGALFLLPFYIWEATFVAPTPLSLEALSIYFYIGVFASVIAWFFWQHSVETVGSVKTSLIYYSMPLFSGLLAIIILSEPVEQYHLIGFTMVLLGITISNLRKLGFVRR